jgi:ribosomal peptide maturation radical SAM protein 1
MDGMSSIDKTILLVSMPFAGINLPSIQLAVLEGYLKGKGVDINSKHLYLKAAEFYGMLNYNHLINGPSDSYTSQMVYSKYVFPEYWNKNKDLFIEYFNRILSESKEFQQSFSFKDYVEKTDQFYNWTINNVEWGEHDLIGFSLNYGQFLPSLAVAKKIKERFPDKKIVLGGSRTVGELGKRVLESFDYIDYIVSGDGEEALFFLASDYDSFDSIPNLIYRENSVIKKSDVFSEIDINTIPILDFNSFFYDLSLTSADVQQYFYYFGRLPVEISRGCWWNKCTFCNHSIQYKGYRDKEFSRVVDELEFLSNKYKILDFHLIGYNLMKNDFRFFIDRLKSIDKDYNLIVEFRADQLKSEDYTNLKDAGFSIIQVGIESFSQDYIKKMHKGVRIIDNIAAIKFCKENGIALRYNIIVNYPNEEKIDFEETKKNIEHIKYFLDPPHVNDLLISYDSPVFNKPDEFNIKNFEYTRIDKLMFPDEYLRKDFSFFYDCKRKEQMENNDWETLIDDWRRLREKKVSEKVLKQSASDTLVLYFLDGGNFLKIVDKRYDDNIRIYNLDENERRIFLSCVDITSYEDLKTKFSYIPDYQLGAILNTFEKAGIVFVEDEYYLSLPLNYRKCLGIKKEKKSADDFVEEEIIK